MKKFQNLFTRQNSDVFAKREEQYELMKDFCSVNNFIVLLVDIVNTGFDLMNYQDYFKAYKKFSDIYCIIFKLFKKLSKYKNLTENDKNNLKSLINDFNSFVSSFNMQMRSFKWGFIELYRVSNIGTSNIYSMKEFAEFSNNKVKLKDSNINQFIKVFPGVSR